MPFEELKHTLYPTLPWPDSLSNLLLQRELGLCFHTSSFLALKDEEYEVCIDSTLEEGYLTYGEYYLQEKARMKYWYPPHIRRFVMIIFWYSSGYIPKIFEPISAILL